jgi:hypothetical protein
MDTFEEKAEMDIAKVQEEIVNIGSRIEYRVSRIG